MAYNKGITLNILTHFTLYSCSFQMLCEEFMTKDNSLQRMLLTAVEAKFVSAHTLLIAGRGVSIFLET